MARYGSCQVCGWTFRLVHAASPGVGNVLPEHVADHRAVPLPPSCAGANRHPFVEVTATQAASRLPTDMTEAA
jgi:hypothetical protein